MGVPADHDCCSHTDAPHSGCCVHHDEGEPMSLNDLSDEWGIPRPEWRVLVCGSRDWDDGDMVWAVLDGILRSVPNNPMVVVHGDYRGADAYAKYWAEHRGVDQDPCPAEWQRYGDGAGPKRNQRMLDEGRPNMVVAFTDDLTQSHGTADMVRKAQEADVGPVYVVGRVKRPPCDHEFQESDVRGAPWRDATCVRCGMSAEIG